MDMPQPSRGRFIALMLIGSGLMALGLMLFLVLRESAWQNAEPEFSTVPTAVPYTPAPDLTLTDLDGNTVALQDYRGSVVLVNLWATWCPPCRREMPTLQAFYEKYRDAGFVLIAIDQEEERDVVVPFVEEYGLTFPVWLDLQYQAERSFGSNVLPSSFVIDREGYIRLKWGGGISETNLEAYVPDIIYGY